MPAPTKQLPFGSSLWGDPVATPAALPAIGEPGEAHVVLDDGDGSTAIYVWNELLLSWEKVADPDLLGGGDVSGPVGAIPNALVVFDGPTGKLIKEATDWTFDPFTGDIVAPSTTATITEIPTPVDGTDVVNKDYVDSALTVANIFANVLLTVEGGLIYGEDEDLILKG
jgi:hypothetical protein